jgi:hypothetical protein
MATKARNTSATAVYPMSHPDRSVRDPNQVAIQPAATIAPMTRCRWSSWTAPATGPA